VRRVSSALGADGTMLGDVQPEPVPSRRGLDDLTRLELHELCEQHGIPDATRTRKQELIAALRAKGVPEFDAAEGGR
jgi:hypothetical protein